MHPDIINAIIIPIKIDHFFCFERNLLPQNWNKAISYHQHCKLRDEKSPFKVARVKKEKWTIRENEEKKREPERNAWGKV